MQGASRITLFIFALLLLLATGCASERPPSGGKTDDTPLQVLASDPAPESVNVTRQRIQLTFNQEITARQLLKLLVMTPSIGRYDIAQNGKSASIQLDNQLESNRTYLLTIDKNLKDHRGRTLPAPYSLAFSTGSTLDSGVMSGKVLNADGSPAAQAQLLAFAERTSAADKESLLTRKAEYVTQSDASGAFSFQHLAAGSYRVVAVRHHESGFRQMIGSEKIGLSSMTLISTGASELLLRFPETSQNLTKEKAISASTDSGGISGRCFASADAVIVEATNAATSWRMLASRDRNGVFFYSFPKLPAGSYTVSAFLPHLGKKADAEQRWFGGSIEPFLPAEPFGVYPAKVTVRARWMTEHVDIHIKTSP